MWYALQLWISDLASLAGARFGSNGVDRFTRLRLYREWLARDSASNHLISI